MNFFANKDGRIRARTSDESPDGKGWSSITEAEYAKAEKAIFADAEKHRLAVVKSNDE